MSAVSSGYHPAEVVEQIKAAPSFAPARKAFLAYALIPFSSAKSAPAAAEVDKHFRRIMSEAPSSPAISEVHAVVSRGSL